MPETNKQFTVEVKARRDDTYSRPRLVFTGGIWDEWDIQFCVHGEKLRWGCDWCDEYFEKHGDA